MKSFGVSLDLHLPLTKTGTQTHIYSGSKNPAILPQLGTILYRYRKNKSTQIDSQGVRQPSEMMKLVVVYIQTKARGINKGIVDLASLLPVINIDNNEVYYDYSANPFVLRLTNRGKWFTRSLLKLYDLSWDQPINISIDGSSPYLESTPSQSDGNEKYNFPTIIKFPTESKNNLSKSQLSPPIAASSELARNVLLDPFGTTLTSYPFLPALSVIGSGSTKKTLPIIPSLNPKGPRLILRKSTPIQIITPNIKINNKAEINYLSGRSWETNSIKIPERSRSNTITLPSEIPSFTFPVDPLVKN